MKIKYMLEQREKNVLFQILWMHEGFLSVEPDDPEVRYECDTGFLVTSACFPGLYGREITLWGCDRDKDSMIAHKFFDTKSEASVYIDLVHRSLAEWAENWHGWGGETETREVLQAVFSA